MNRYPVTGEANRLSLRAAGSIVGTLALGATLALGLSGCGSSGEDVHGRVLSVVKNGGIPESVQTQIYEGQKCTTVEEEEEEPVVEGTSDTEQEEEEPVQSCSPQYTTEEVETTPPVTYTALVDVCDANGKNCWVYDAPMATQYQYLPGSCYPTPDACDKPSPSADPHASVRPTLSPSGVAVATAS